VYKGGFFFCLFFFDILEGNRRNGICFFFCSDTLLTGDCIEQENEEFEEARFGDDERGEDGSDKREFAEAFQEVMDVDVDGLDEAKVLIEAYLFF
jgi:hypothetical protein